METLANNVAAAASDASSSTTTEKRTRKPLSPAAQRGNELKTAARGLARHIRNVMDQLKGTHVAVATSVNVKTICDHINEIILFANYMSADSQPKTTLNALCKTLKTMVVPVNVNFKKEKVMLRYCSGCLIYTYDLKEKEISRPEPKESKETAAATAAAMKEAAQKESKAKDKDVVVPAATAAVVEEEKKPKSRKRAAAAASATVAGGEEKKKKKNAKGLFATVAVPATVTVAETKSSTASTTTLDKLWEDDEEE